MPATKETTYNEAEIAERLKELPGWYYEDGWIRRVYKTDGWPTTLMLVNAVGYLAEAAYHHPDLTVTWGRMTVKLQNHAAGGITDKDFELARKIEEVALWRPHGRRARGHAEQVGPAGGSTVAPAAAPRKVLFVTGRLAEPALRRVLDEMAPPFEAAVAVLKITVAALMTTPWIARFLEVPPRHRPGAHPGPVRRRHRGPAASGSACRSRKGPKDLREIPRYFGQAAGRARATARTTSRSSPRSTTPRSCRREAVRAAADYFRASGADIIDIGCTPGLPFPALGDVVRELRGAGMRVSVDSFDPGRDPHGRRGRRRAGAERQRLQPRRSPASSPARGARVVVDPRPRRGARDPASHASRRSSGWGVGYLIDPVIEPIGFGFMASLERYAEVHRRYPDAAQLMGVGNITELTSADTTGVNALLLAICQETGVRAVLTTEVIPWARGAVREIDIARRLMHYAVTAPHPAQGRGRPAGHGQGSGDPGVRRGRAAPAPRRRQGPQLPHLHRPRRTITVFNDEIFVRGTDIQEIFAQLGVDEATHAFYLGRELARRPSSPSRWARPTARKARCAWGYLTPPDDVRVGAREADAAPQRAPDAPRAAGRRPMSDGCGAAGGQPGRDGRPDRGRGPVPRPSVARVPRQRHRRPARAATPISSAATPSSPPTRRGSSAARAADRDRRPRLAWTPHRRAIRCSPCASCCAPFAAAPVSGLPPFQGGAAGYIGYDYGAVLERLPAPALRRSRDSRRHARPVRLGDRVGPPAGHGVADLDRTARDRRRRARSGRAERLAMVRERLGRRPPDATATSGVGAAAPPRAGRRRPTRCSASRRPSRSDSARPSPTAAISTRWPGCASTSSPATSSRPTSRSGSRPRSPSRRSTSTAGSGGRNPAPFAAYLDFGELPVLSASPERFLRLDENGRHVETRPIKGTRPRGPRPDARRGARPRAGRERQGPGRERDDRGSAAERPVAGLPAGDRPGARAVRAGAASDGAPPGLDRRRASSSPAADAVDLLRAAFPGGSITGAPKVRAMEIIAELEPSRRGVYCGSIGYLVDHRRDGHQHRDPYLSGAPGPGILPGGRRHRRRLRSRAGIPGDAGQGAGADRARWPAP